MNPEALLQKVEKAQEVVNNRITLLTQEGSEIYDPWITGNIMSLSMCLSFIERVIQTLKLNEVTEQQFQGFCLYIEAILVLAIFDSNKS